MFEQGYCHCYFGVKMNYKQTISRPFISLKLHLHRQRQLATKLRNFIHFNKEPATSGDTSDGDR